MSKAKTLLHDPRYPLFYRRYTNDLVRYVCENSRHQPTWQQIELYEAIQVPGSRVAAASGHGTGKSASLAWVIDWHVRCKPKSNGMLTATNIEQCRLAVWKYLDEVQEDMVARFPWQSGHVIKEAKRYYVKGHKDSWYFIPKTASKAKPENVAGQHNDNYIVLVDEASGVDDLIHGVLRGALTHKNNRYVMTSQPTRPVGHFAEAFGALSGIYKTFNLNSELSPIVSREFIAEKLVEYGGHHSPEYQIKVLGCLPDNLSGYLIPKVWCEDAQKVTITHAEAWGWVLVADVAEGVHRDSSTWALAKVSGYGADRQVEVIRHFETLDQDEMRFAREIHCIVDGIPNITIAVDADGPGRTVVLVLEELGHTVERITWGLPPHSDADKKRYMNQRAYASVKAREAIFAKRLRMAPGKKVVEQASRIPYKIDEKGRYAIMPKEQMKSQGIKSPDLFDIHCFFYLVDYIPATDEATDVERDNVLDWAQRIINGEV